MKKALSLLLVVLLVGSMLAGCAAEEQNAVVGMITDTGGLGDQSFNDSAWAGMTRAEEEFGISKKVLESETADDYFPNLVSFAEEDADLVVGVGFLFNEAMIQAAEKFPEQKFAIVDSVVEADNVASITFAENEGSFLVGVIAGMQTETNKVGFIGGMKFPLIEKFEYGFRAGVKAVNPEAEVFVNYADSFEDAAKGKEIALVQHQKGADVIYHAAGGVGVGLIQAAEEEGFWAIGVDQDQSALSPSNVLCSMIKRVDNAVFQTIEAVQNDTFEGGVSLFDLKANGVGYSDDAGNLSDELKAAADKYADAVKDGTITVPATMDEFEAFEAPAL
ncbi:BMP family lipoprotein [Fusibacter sp. JL216-2]|uniref:BMP family lipoprotein n=1 Tax=Fusibacter sp. JL216-2 TaxID=3071453 RepID=UPI003D33B8E7